VTVAADAKEGSDANATPHMHTVTHLCHKAAFLVYRTKQNLILLAMTSQFSLDVTSTYENFAGLTA